MSDTLNSNETTKNLASGLFTSNNFQVGMGALSTGVSSVFGSIPTPHSDLNSNNGISSDIRGAAESALMSGVAGPWGMAAGAALTVMDKTGGFSDASQGLGRRDDTMNMIASLAIPGAGWFTRNVGHYSMSNDMKEMSGGYRGSVVDNLKAAQNSGKILFGRRKAKRLLAEALTRDDIISGIKNATDEDRLAEQSMTLAIGYGNLFNLLGGYDLRYMRAAKFGMKIKEARRLLNKFKSGGIVGTSLKSTDEDNQFFTLIFAKGGKPRERKYKTYKEFSDYYTSSGRKLDKDYDMESAYNDDSAYFAWEDEEKANPGQGHFTDRYKKPSHITFSKESVYSVGPKQGGLWFNVEGVDYFEPTEWQLNDRTLDEYMDYFKQAEPNAGLRYKGIDYTPQMIAEYKPVVHIPTLNSFALGGELNVIPEGALHARKHHMIDDEHITKKGIPVVAEKVGGDIELQAEIEREEIIFRLSVTLRIEEYWKRYKETNDDKYAIEAGKLLATEIMENTDDRTGLKARVA